MQSLRQLSAGYWGWLQAIVGVLGARVVGAGFAFIGNVFVARWLGPAAFGDFYLLFTIMTIVAGLTGPAIDTSLVRFAARTRHSGPARANTYFAFAWRLKLAMALLTLVAGAGVAWPLHALLFNSAGAPPVWTVTLAFAGGVAVSLWGFSLSYFQAHERFTPYSAFECASSMLRFTLVVGLVLAAVRLVPVYLAVYVAAPATMACIAWWLVPRAVVHAPTSWAVGAELFRFAKWVLLATVFTTLVQRLDLVLLAALGVAQEEVGRYGAAVSLVLLGELVLLTLYSVLLPKASALREAGHLRQFIGGFRIPSLLLCLGLGGTIPLAPIAIPILFGGEYVGTELYYIHLLCGVMASVAVSPAMTALYAVGEARLIALFEGLRLALVLGLALVVVPAYGALGMAVVAGGVRAVINLGGYLVAHQRVKRIMLAEDAAGGASSGGGSSGGSP